MGAIVFDLDGTLVDSAPDIAAAANRMLADFGLAPLPEPQLRGFIGHGIPSLVGKVIAACGLDPALLPEMNARMVAQYAARPATLTRPYPGVVECLQTLTGQGHRLGLCTNKDRAIAVQILHALDIARFFAAVVGGDSLPQRKPDPAPLHHTFALLGAEPLLYVGDNEVDVEAAEAAGLDLAIYTGGYRKTPVNELPHRFAFDDHSLLPSVVSGM
ncbi:phosphoglycolate phosphatase [Tabrizicola thermarum]|uniref:phosphoglycolate phosphatase n=1 Tax=Tabrizicola thermarum TaxID=2670345 RepID=UPI000FFBE7DF|nr:phosphoglycolate phosphatase [Tabrizicola thermarum]